MGTRKLLLLVLILSSYTLAQEEGSDSQNPTCLKDSTKFKHLRKYVYNYEAGASTGVTGTADSQSGSKFNCKVELEVPQPCSFVLRIKQCTLREVYGFSSEGKALLKKSKNSDEFSSAMSKNEVSFSISYGKEIALYPQEDEPLSILNIKRGIISALLVAEDTQNEIPMDTVYGKCSSEVIVSSSKGTTLADGTVVRNLKKCDRFTPIRDHVSPIALFKGLNAPLSTLMKSSQSCQYTLETKRKQVTEVSCAESHIFLPFSNKGQYGITAKVTQTLKLEDTSKTNNRDFFADRSLARGLALEASDSVTSSEDAVLENLVELQKMSASEQNQQRAGRFYKLVTSLRSLKNETLGPLVPKMTALSNPIVLQALIQCGTAECFGAILQVLRSGDISPVITDSIIYSLGLLPSPCTKRVREFLNMARYRTSRATFYALSHAVSNFYEDTNTVTEEVKDVSDFMTSRIANECSGDEEETFLALKAIGIMGKAMENANAAIKPSLLQCAMSRSASAELQKAAIKAFRRMTVTHEVQESLVWIFQDTSSPVPNRLAAYLMVMKDPSNSSLRKIANTLNAETNEQVKNFVASHIVNILTSDAPDTQLLKNNLEELLKDTGVPQVIEDFTKLSRNYLISKNVKLPNANGVLGATLEGNVMFDSGSYMPAETMLQATLNVFDQSFDMFEVGIEGKGFEPTLDALFGKEGFFPDSAMKALYWVDGKVPDKVREILFKWFNVPRDSKQSQDFTKSLLLNAEKLIKDVQASDAPEAKAYLEILGKELGYFKLSDFKILRNMLRPAQELPGQIIKEIYRGVDADLFLHYIFMDNEFDLPTGSGLQLQVSLSGTVAPGAKVGMKLGSKNVKAELTLKPAVSMEFVTQLGVQIPGFSKHAIQMNSNLFHESGADARLSLKDGQIKFSIPAPKGPTKLFSFSNNFNLVYASKTEVMASITENRQEWSSCRPLLTGLKYCINTAYSNASTKDEAPYFPLTGQTRFELEIQPTGEVEEYSLTAGYRLQRDGQDFVDTLVFSAQAEGAQSCEATWITRYNRNKITFTSDVQIPKSGVDFGFGMKVDDQTPGLYSVVLDFHNQQISEVTLTGKLSSAENEAMYSGVLSIPRLHSEAKAEASIQNLLNVFKLQLQSSANICAFSASQNIMFTYDNEKIELEWSTGTNSNVKKLVSKLPDIRFDDLVNYPESMKNYANDVLDYQVPQTDMTLRHIVSQSLVATNNWLRTASKDMPYATTLRNKLEALRELELGLPPFPEELFLNSDGKIKYLINKDGITINIPLPFGGKSSHQVMMARSLRSPSVDMPSVGFRLPSQEFRIPAFTIPEYYQLRVPLIGVLELSSNIRSNYYNWSASYTGGNTSSDASTFSTKYNMRAQSVLDILSYNIDGSALISYDPEQMLTISYEGSTSHTLLESNIKLHELYNFRSKEMFKGSYSYAIRSILGIESSLTSSMKSTADNKVVIIEGDTAGRHKLASLFLNTDWMTATTIDTENLQAKSESNFRLDSSYLKLTNKISGTALQDALTITSTTDMQDGALSNLITLDYRNKQLFFKSDTNGNYYNLVALNKFEATISSQMAAMRSEYQADYRRHRLYTLLSGSLNSLGLELNADATINNQQNRAAHKATLKLNQEGLSTSATTNVNFNPLTLENEFNAGIGPSGASMKMTANGKYRENNAKVTFSGKAALTELSFGSVYQATLLGLDSKNILNFRISKDGLRAFNNLMGSYDQIKLENSHELNIEKGSLQFTSKFDNTLSSDKSYKQSFELQMQPYTVTAVLNNKFQYGLLALTNKGQMQLEGFKVNFNGDLQGAYNKDEVKHSYALVLNGLTSSLSTDTVANIQGTVHTHRASMEIAGLSASFSCNLNCETKSMRFTNRIQSVVAPFSFKFDSQTAGDGRLQTLGDHTGQLYSKVLLNAEVLSFNFVHDYRGSTLHLLDGGRKHETLLDYQISVLFTPSEQLSSWKLKSHLDQNSYSHSFSAYNNLDAIGLELSGKTAADMSILDRQVVLPFAKFNAIDALNLRDRVNTPQEFGISGYVKYDKNKDMHVINLPFMQSMSASFGEIRNVLLTSLKALQKFLLNFDQHLKTYNAYLSKIPQKMNDYISSLDVEAKLQEAKKRIRSLTDDYKITAEELQAAIEHYLALLQRNLQQEVFINNCIRSLDSSLRSLKMLAQNILEQLKALDVKYQIRQKIADTIQDLKKFVEEMNINDLHDSVKAWIQNVDDLYQIRNSFLNFLQKIQAYIQRIDIQAIEKNVKDFLESVEWRKYAEEAFRKVFPLETLKYVIKQAENVILTMFEEYDLSEKINTVVDKLQDIVSEYEIDKKIQLLIEKFLQFLSQQNVKETIQKAADILNSIDIKTHLNKIRSSVDVAVKKVKDYDYKSLIDDINYYLDVVIKKIRSFDYDRFVDDVNEWIRAATKTINDQMKALELPQKAEALKQYLDDVRKVTKEYIQQLGETKLSAAIQWYQDIMSSTVLNDFKVRMLESLEDARDRIYSMDIQKECQRYLEKVSQAYRRLVTFVSEQWNAASEMITRFAEENNIREWAENVKRFIEEGFTVQEFKLGFLNIPSFEVSLRALREATFKTPYFTVPFTDLQVPSVEVNFRRLRDLEIPTRIVTPAFTIFNTYKIPSYTIDLNEIKLKIARTIEQILSSDFRLPSPEIYLKDLKLSDLTMNDMGFPAFSIPEIYVPSMQIPELRIPKLNLLNFEFSDISIPDFQLPKIPHTVSVPTFGKLHSSFEVTSPFFTMKTSAEVKNATVSENSPEFVATLSSEATSMMEALAFVVAADARVSAPLLERLVLKESVLLSNKYVKLDHNGEVTFSRNQIQTKIGTKANLKTEMNSAEFQNDMSFRLQKKFTADINTKYNHRLNIPQLEITSQLELHNDVDSSVEAGRILFTSAGKGNWNWACPLFTDIGTHQADFKFNLRGPLIEMSGANRVIDKYLKLDQSIKYESGFLSYVNLDIMSKADCANVGNSIVEVKGKAQVSEMKIELTAAHNAELSGRSTGTISNSLSFLMKPFETRLSTNNNGNLKVSFPLRLTGKIDFLNNYDFILSPSIQETSWQVKGRFNQYKVSHSISLGNNEENIGASVEINGEANLDFLTIPITIPEIPVPYTTMKTPKVTSFSLWERSGLKNLLTTTKQNVDLNIKLQYMKNKDVHSIPVNLEAIYDAIYFNLVELNYKFDRWREPASAVLTNMYNKANEQFEKYKIDTQANKIPTTLRIPGYTIPLLNIEVKPYVAELPAFGYMMPKEIRTPGFTLPVLGFTVPTYRIVMPSLEFPVLHVPKTLSRMSLPNVKINRMQEILIPAMGNLTYDFAFKSNVISLTTSAGLYNQSDISARFSVISTSVIDALQFSIDGTSGLTRKRGLKLATALALKNAFMEGKHESSMSFGRRNIEASVATNGKINIPILQLIYRHELTGNTKTKPTVSSKMTMSYVFSESVYENNAKGSLDHSLNIEGLSSYLSLESVTKGEVTGTFMSHQTFSGKLTNEANTYLNSNGLRSSMKTLGDAKADGFATLGIAENLAVEASTSRIYAVWEHVGENYLRYTPAFTTRGSQNCKATVELSFWSLLSNLQLQIEQPSSFFDALSLSEAVTLNLYPEKQEFDFNGQGVLESIVLAHNIKLSNDPTDAKFVIGGSLQGHVDFLKSIILPVYEKSVWDVLKFDLKTSPEEKQSLSLSTSIVYTKNKEGFFFEIPVNKLSDGFVIKFPALTLNLKDLPNTLSNMEVPDITELNIPSFNVPFTNLNVPSYKIDLSNIKIHKKLSTLPFDLSLPSLPKVKFPKVDITTKYITLEEYKIPFFEVTIPRHQITLARYTLPKSYYGVDFNRLANKIADIDLPTIEIPEQNIEFPPIKMNLPAGLFIPAFGALSGSIQLNSPIYNLTWTTQVSNSSESLVASIDATSSSTLRFLEFDLEASATSALAGSALNFIGKGALAHPDLSIDWQQDISFNGLRFPTHNVLIDVRSPTFTNVQIRCQRENNRLSSSVTCTSTGTLGLVIEKEDATIKGKVYTRSLTSSGNDNMLMKGEISLKNPQKIQNQFNWKEDAVQEALSGLKERLPTMSDAIYNCFNKYHTEHFGMDASDARRKMKEHLQSKITSTYKSAVNQIDKIEYELQSAARHASYRYSDIMKNAQKMYQDPASTFMNYDDLKARFFDNTILVLRKYQTTVKELIDAAIEFLKSTRFQLPGQTQRYTGEELLSMGMQRVKSCIDHCNQKIQQLFDACIQSLSDVKFDIPGTKITIEGAQVLESIKNFLVELNKIVRDVVTDIQNASFEKTLKQLKNLLQQVAQKSEKLIEALQLRNYEELKAQTQQMYKDAVNSEYAKQLSYYAERVRKILQQLQAVFQSGYDQLSEKLEQLLIYVRALREEYLDPNVVGWSVKYYEIEDKIIQLVKQIINSLKELPSKYNIKLSEALDNMREYLIDYYQQAGEAMSYTEGRAREMFNGISVSLNEKITELSNGARKAAVELNQILSSRLQEAYDKLANSYEKFIFESNRLIDVVIEQYNTVIEFIMQVLRNFEKSVNDVMTTYISARKGEIKIDVPHPFNWKSFDEMPEIRDDIINKKLEIARSMVFDGMERGSKKWEELQSFIEQQLEDGKLTAQQIIENIKNWKKN